MHGDFQRGRPPVDGDDLPILDERGGGATDGGLGLGRLLGAGSVCGGDGCFGQRECPTMHSV